MAASSLDWGGRREKTYVPILGRLDALLAAAEERRATATRIETVEEICVSRPVAIPPGLIGPSRHFAQCICTVTFWSPIDSAVRTLLKQYPFSCSDHALATTAVTTRHLDFLSNSFHIGSSIRPGGKGAFRWFIRGRLAAFGLVASMRTPSCMSCALHRAHNSGSLFANASSREATVAETRMYVRPSTQPPLRR